MSAKRINTQRTFEEARAMKCPTCGVSELIHDIRDLPYSFGGASTTIPAVEADWCSACGESITGPGESGRVMTAMIAFNKEVKAACAANIRFDQATGLLYIDLVDGQCLSYRPQDLRGLEKATAADLARFEISPFGRGIHFPTLDADLWVPGLLQGLTGTQAWMHMHSSPHPGEVLAEYLEGLSLDEAALKLGVDRVAVERIIAGELAISSDLAKRLGSALGTSEELWLGLQTQHDGLNRKLTS